MVLLLLKVNILCYVAIGKNSKISFKSMAAGKNGGMAGDTGKVFIFNLR